MNYNSVTNLSAMDENAKSIHSRRQFKAKTTRTSQVIWKSTKQNLLEKMGVAAKKKDKVEFLNINYWSNQKQLNQWCTGRQNHVNFTIRSVFRGKEEVITNFDKANATFVPITGRSIVKHELDDEVDMEGYMINRQRRIRPFLDGFGTDHKGSFDFHKSEIDSSDDFEDSKSRSKSNLNREDDSSSTIQHNYDDYYRQD